MCSFAAGMFGVSALMQIGGAIAKGSAANDDYSRKVAAINAEADALNKSTAFNYNLDNLQEMQIQNQGQTQEGQAQTKLLAATGEAAGAAASSGVSGNSVQDLYRSYAVATGKDIMAIRANVKGQMGQAEAQKQQQNMDAKNKLLALKEGLPQNPASSIIGNYVSAALGVGKDFMADTTAVSSSKSTGGLFGQGGFLGVGRDFG